jgi:hypothetical protein
MTTRWHGVMILEARPDGDTFHVGNSTFVAAIFSNLLTATGAGARFLPPRFLQKN